MPNLRFDKTSLLYAALACSVVLNVVLLLNRRPSDESEIASIAELQNRLAAVESALDEGAEAPTDTAPVATEPYASPEPPAGPPTAPDTAIAGWEFAGSKVTHSLARTLQQAVGDDGAALTSVFTRLFVWELDMRRDLQPGDTLAVIWRKTPDGLPEIAAASLQTSKLGRTVQTYRWQAPGDAFASYWHLDGTEVPLRLKDGPLTHYEQITSLLKDRPTHKGMDFKTPVGTEVTAPRAGVVTRTNWNWKANGNGIEIRYDDGVLAKFLHLSENRVKTGDRVKAGKVIALSGNTGNSTAPHLHYQLDLGKKTLDPLNYHGTYRRSLDAGQVAALKVAVAPFQALLERPAGD